ncbi:MAG TPA: DMT family transporter [candidate division Zixibacteria bacterium]|nr:DMT family transporter [candidate division Zixibacteria bacterium]
MAHRSSPIEWLVFGILGFVWGSSYLFIKIGVETLTPLTLVAGRVGIGAAVLAVAMLVARQALPRRAPVYGHLVVMALLGIVIPFFLITWGEQTIDSGLAAILTGTVPLFAIVMAALVLADEPITTNRLAGLVVGFVGVVLITSPGLSGGMGGSMPGQLALLGASVSYAAAGVYGRRMLQGVPAMTSAFGEVGFAFVISAALALILEDPFATQVEASTVLSLAWLGLTGSGLAFLAFFFLLNRWGATRTSLVAYLLPVVGVILGVLVADEQISLPVLAGMVLIIGGVATANLRFGQRRLLGRGPSVAPQKRTVPTD